MHGIEVAARLRRRPALADGALVAAQLGDELIDYAGFRRRQAALAAEGRYLGIGFGLYIEQTAHTTNDFIERGVPINFGYDTVRVRMDPSGKVQVDSSLLEGGRHGPPHRPERGRLRRARWTAFQPQGR